VAFASVASNLIPGDTNGLQDVFVYDRKTGITRRVSVATDGSQANGTSVFFFNKFPAISSDGRFVAFSSLASNLVTDDTNGTFDVFVHDRQSGVTERVSVATNGDEGSSYSSFPAMSADGRFIAFVSDAPNLVPGDTNGVDDLFLHDRQTKTTMRVASVNSQGNTIAFNPTISADGRFVSFTSRGSDGGVGVYVYDKQTGVTQLLAPGGYKATISADGHFVSFVSSFSLVPEDNNGDLNRTI